MNDFFPIIISGPAGSGKSTLINNILAGPYGGEFCSALSVTTRSPREGEKDGVDYRFISREEFERLLSSNMFLEYTEYCGDFYGLCKSNLPEDKHAIFIVDINGAQMLKKEYPNAISIMILPPDFKTQRERLLLRGSESDESLTKRLVQTAYDLEHLNDYDYIIINDKLSLAREQFIHIIVAERSKSFRNLEFKNVFFSD